jgi:hypothetical protein
MKESSLNARVLSLCFSEAEWKRLLGHEAFLSCLESEKSIANLVLLALGILNSRPALDRECPASTIPVASAERAVT